MKRYWTNRVKWAIILAWAIPVLGFAQADGSGLSAKAGENKRWGYENKGEKSGWWKKAATLSNNGILGQGFRLEISWMISCMSVMRRNGRFPSSMRRSPNGLRKTWQACS